MTELSSLDEARADLSRLKDLAKDVLASAKERGASSAEAALSVSAGLSATVRMGEVESIEHTRDKALAVTVYFGHRKGSASTSDFDGKAIGETVSAACQIARHTAEDPFAGLADSELMATDTPDLDLYHSWPISPEQAIELALRTEQSARNLDSRITNSEGASVGHHEGTSVYANSHGFVGGRSSTRHSVSCAVIAEDDSGMQRDYWYTLARDPAELEGARIVGERAAERALKRLSPRRLSTRTAPVIFTADVATGLFAHLINAIRGGNLYRKASFLVDHLGKRILPEFVRIHEQPHLRKAIGSKSFDHEGVATVPRDIVTEGVLQGYVLNSYSARKLGMQTTGNAGGVHNLTVDPGSEDLAGLIARMGTGLIVSELLGMGVNTVTGDYSRGAAGFWVEDGEVLYPVQEITVAANLRDMFLGIQAIGTDMDVRGNIRTGSVLVDRMTVAGA